jgi:hypothetical protein
MVNVRLVEEHVKCAFVTADKLLKQFEEFRIVKEVTGGQRNRRYEYSPYLALFEPAKRETLARGLPCPGGRG